VKKAISITLSSDSLLWLRAQAAARTRGNVSEVVDRLIQDARAAGRTDRSAITSVAGTIDLPDDESLAQAESHVHGLFERSLGRPMLVREPPPKRAPRRG
jgi:hypothetical protein